MTLRSDLTDSLAIAGPCTSEESQLGFRRALEGLEGDDELSEATRVELSGYLASFPDVKQAIELGWTTPDGIEHFG